MISVIKKSIVYAEENYIALGCNATANQAGGINHFVYNKYPYGNIYKYRSQRFVARGVNFPGHIKICHKANSPSIINMLINYYPGSPISENSPMDGVKARIGFFARCLVEISMLENLKSIAFPLKIGCGILGGDWDIYLSMISKFEARVNEKRSTKVVLYDDNA